MVAASMYSGPGRGTPAAARAPPCAREQAVVGHGVDVAAQRAVHEADEHPLLDLLDRGRLDRGRGRRASTARADRGSGRRSSRCPGVWSRGWLRKNSEPAARPQHPGHLGDGLVDGVDVLEHEAGHDGVEGGVDERQGLGARAGVHRPAAPAGGLVDLGHRRVDRRPPCTPRRWRAAGRPDPPPCRPRAPGRPGEPSTASGRICSVVLGVGAVGELAAATSSAWASQRSPGHDATSGARVRPVMAPLERPGRRRRGSCRARPRPPSSGSQDSARSSSSAACSTLPTPPSSLTSRFRRVSPEAGDVVEHRRGHALAAQLAVERDGEPVGLVADALQQVQRLGLTRHAHRLGAARP